MAFIKNDAITSRDEDFALWYTEICKKAELMDYTSTKGFIIYKPYGYAIWELIQKQLDSDFKKKGTHNVYMPLVIPESLFQKEKDHVEGFAPETLIATIGGNKELEDRLIIRPTSECLFTEHFAKIISSYRDLPLIYNQWCSVVRWEKTTRPFLRGSEFLWQEGHTMHATKKEASKMALDILKVYKDLGKNVLAVPFLTGRKTDKEKFAGAEVTYTIEALMHDGKSLQSGTTHYFGTGFAEAFGAKYLDKDGTVKYPHQTSWGLSTRLIGSIIMVHGDDNGLVLPPYVAPTQVVIIPIRNQEEIVSKTSKSIYRKLKNKFRVILDDNDSKTPGWKFSQYEMKGVPLRIEIGPRDLANGIVTVSTRYNGEKVQMKVEDVTASTINKILKDIHQNMYNKAEQFLNDNIYSVNTYNELQEVISHGGYAKTMWCGKESCEDKVKADMQATSRCLPFDQTPHGDICPICGKKAKKVVYFAKAY